MGGEDGLWVELEAEVGEGAVADGEDDFGFVGAAGDDFEFGRGFGDREGVVAGDGELAWRASEERVSLVDELAGLAVDGAGCVADLAAGCDVLLNAMVARADA